MWPFCLFFFPPCCSRAGSEVRRLGGHVPVGSRLCATLFITSLSMWQAYSFGEVLQDNTKVCDLVRDAREHSNMRTAASKAEKDQGCVGFVASNTGPGPGGAARSQREKGRGLDLVVCPVRRVCVGFCRCMASHSSSFFFQFLIAAAQHCAVWRAAGGGRKPHDDPCCSGAPV